MTANEVNAIIKLLEDSPEVKALMEQQLSKLPMEELTLLRDRVCESNLEVAFHIDMIIQDKASEDFIEEMKGIASTEQYDLEKLVSFLARFIDNKLTDKQVSAALDKLAEEGREYIASHPDPNEVNVFIEFMGRKCGYRGNEKNYYAIGNSSVFCALESKRGLPITLSALYILIGKRLDIPVKGIALPSHFIIGVFSPDKTRFFDPFHSGRELSKESCKVIVKRAGYAFTDDLLESADERSIFLRMLNNLKYVFSREGKEDEEVVVDRLLQIWTEKFFRHIF